MGRQVREGGPAAPATSARSTAKAAAAWVASSAVLSWTISNLAYLVIGVRFDPGPAQLVARWAPLVLPLVIAPLTTVPRVRLQNRLQAVNEQLREEIARGAQLQAELEYQSRHDPLTGVLNRRGFFEAVEALVGTDALLLLVDLDSFKDVNDTYGHAAGDAVLQAVAGELALSDHEGAAVVGRLGGDEFALLLPAQARTQAELVRCRLAGLPVRLPDGAEVVASASVGLAEMGEDETVADVLARTDAAMYGAKRARLPARTPTGQTRTSVPERTGWQGAPPGGRRSVAP